MTNINWKVRIKNPMFWVQIVVAIFVPVLGYYGARPNYMASSRQCNIDSFF